MAGKSFHTWGNGVRVHAAPSAEAAVVHTLPGPTEVLVSFQVHGELVRAEGIANDAWAFLPAQQGFLSNIYINVPESWLPGVPEGEHQAHPAHPAHPEPPVHAAGLPAVPGLTAEQVGNARTIVRTGQHHHLPRQGIVVAVVTALQESSLVNLLGGDKDSVGLFQQRPSQGWGTVAQCHNPVLAAEAFYGCAAHTHNPGLLQVKGWEQMSVARAAQAVQRSANGSLYAKREPMARDLVERLR